MSNSETTDQSPLIYEQRLLRCGPHTLTENTVVAGEPTPDFCHYETIVTRARGGVVVGQAVLKFNAESVLTAFRVLPELMEAAGNKIESDARKAALTGPTPKIVGAMAVPRLPPDAQNGRLRLDR